MLNETSALRYARFLKGLVADAVSARQFEFWREKTLIQHVRGSFEW